jgi:hypothetical protein
MNRNFCRIDADTRRSNYKEWWIPAGCKVTICFFDLRVDFIIRSSAQVDWAGRHRSKKGGSSFLYVQLSVLLDLILFCVELMGKS